ncbi:MAG: ATP-binding protein [Eubacterium sp.]|nr:ATP-binding protein [Eubacterium sp.]
MLFDKKDSARRENSSLLEEYSNKVFRLVMFIVPIFFLCGNGTMTILHYLGMYPGVNDIAMWFSNAVDISFLGVAVYMVRTSYGPNGRLNPRILPIAKITLMVMVVIQWNLNSYICPFEGFWAYAPLFTIVEAFFFDVIMVHWTTLLIVISIVISWVVNGENLLPGQDDFFLLNLIFRGICLTFTLLSVYIITWFGKVFIVEVVASREKEREIREKSDEYEREARIKSDFLANMSHEIRTPMNAVIGMAEIAMREDLTPTAVDCLAQIQKSGRNLLNIINDILDYSKIDSGKMEIMPERYEPVAELNDISNILATRIGDKDLQLFFFIDPRMPHALRGDAMRIRQILINLTNNAIKFTQEGSVGVIVTCELFGDDTAILTYHIKDTGIGIKREDLEKLFVSFQQVDSRRNRSVEGTGLGLAISQKLVEAMGGTVGVNSVYGKGSDFWFTIPQKVLEPGCDLVVEDAKHKRGILLDSDHARASIFAGELERLGVEKLVIESLDEYSEIPGIKDYLFFKQSHFDDRMKVFLEEHSEVNGALLIDFNSAFKSDRENLYTVRRPVSTQKMVRILNGIRDTQQYEEEAYAISFTAPEAKILIVDDNAINITIAEGLLAPMDMQLDSALSGAEAIRKIKNEDYDIVLMDHMMPEMDGVDATKIIRETIKREDELVIIALSANAVKEARDMFLAVGMNDFVAKPIEIKELVAKLRKWLPDEKIHKGEAVKAVTAEVLADPLADFDMLDAQEAVKMLGSPQLLRTIAEEYYKSGRSNYSEIKLAYDNEDMENYTIKVHALKSSSRQIGAFLLGDKAEALEKAGKSSDKEFIRENTDEMLAMYSELLDKLAVVFPETEGEAEELPLIDEEQLRELLGRAKEACESFDTDRMEEVALELRRYSWPAEFEGDVSALCEAVDRMEIITCEDILEHIYDER